MKIFVTGGSGFLGREVILRILDGNNDVFALSRSQNSDQTILQLGATPVRGDLNNVESLIDSLSGVDVVIHCAAPVEFWGPWEKYQSGIIDATIGLLDVANSAGVKRFIHISSESVLQDKEALLNINETKPYPKKANSFYGESKKRTEELLLMSPHAIEIIIIRPTFIWGQDCSAISTILKKVESKEFLWINHGNASFEAVHVKNVAEIISLALTHGQNRGVYIVTDDEESTVEEFFSEIFNSFQIEIPKKSIPLIIATPIAWIVENLWKIFALKSVPPLQTLI